MDLQILPVTTSKEKVKDENQLVFGKQYTDRMLIMEYDKGQGWHSARIQPYGPISLDPAAMVLHYSQEIFEGLKVFRRPDGSLSMFRPADNITRFNRSAERMCMPEVDETFFLDAMLELIRLEADWVPRSAGTSLYVRPTMIATEPMLGVRPADQYLCYVILSPVGPYYKGGIAPVKIWISDFYVRATEGGTGEAKTGGNYASALRHVVKAREEHGADQVLFCPNGDVQETGASNFFLINDSQLLTKPLDASFLHGVTRDSVITLARDLNYDVIERDFTVAEVMDWIQTGEAALSGTAAVLSGVGSFVHKGATYKVGDGSTGPNTRKLSDALRALQSGRTEDRFGWLS